MQDIRTTGYHDICIVEQCASCEGDALAFIYWEYKEYCYVSKDTAFSDDVYKINRVLFSCMVQISLYVVFERLRVCLSRDYAQIDKNVNFAVARDATVVIRYRCRVDQGQGRSQDSTKK